MQKLSDPIKPENCKHTWDDKRVWAGKVVTCNHCFCKIILNPAVPKVRKNKKQRRKEKLQAAVDKAVKEIKEGSIDHAIFVGDKPGEGTNPGTGGLINGNL